MNVYMRTYTYIYIKIRSKITMLKIKVSQKMSQLYVLQSFSKSC